MHALITTFTVGFALEFVAFAQPSVETQPSALFTQLGLTAQQRAAIDDGRPVAKVLSWGGPSEVYVFGAVYIDGSAAAYLKAARNVGQLAGSPGTSGSASFRPLRRARMSARSRWTRMTSRP